MGMIMVLATKIRSISARSNESGSALVEFALTSIILFMVIFAIIDFSLALYADHFVAYAAREATRYAMVRGSSWTTACSTPSNFSCKASSANIQAFVTNIIPPGLTTANLTVIPTWTGATPAGGVCSTTNDPGCVVKVQVKYQFNFLVLKLPAAISISLPLTSTAAATIAQ